MEYTNPKNINEFKRILKTLQNSSSVNLPELRELREQQQYLVKLKDQRQKIESLKSRFDERERQTKKLQTQNQMLRKNKYLNEQEKYKQYESSIKSIEHDRQRFRIKLLELENEKQELKKALKIRDLTIQDVQQQYKQKLKDTQDGFLVEKRRLIDYHQEQLKEIDDSHCIRQQISELQILVQRQNKALKMQEESLLQETSRNDNLQEQIQCLRQMYEKSNRQNNQLLGQLQFYKNEAHSISKKLKAIQEQEVAKRELEYLKLKMNQMRRGEIENLESIVNQIRN